MPIPPILSVTKSIRDGRWLMASVGVEGMSWIIQGPEALTLQQHVEREGGLSADVTIIPGVDDADLLAAGHPAPGQANRNRVVVIPYAGD